MINIQYRKGQPCIHANLFCQEGFCSECEIASQSVKIYEAEAREKNKTVRVKMGIQEPVMAIK